jgi:hypothetical protein
MKERPIKFKAEGVRAILAGMKTQTRRIIKPAPRLTPSGLWTWKHKLYGNIRHEDSGVSPIDEWSELCPRGQVGDRLWVKEKWGISGNGPYYHADITNPGNVRYAFKNPHDMPRWASRITLEITKIRVQRVQEITREDVLAEGVNTDGGDDETRNRTTLENYRLLWDSLYAKSGYGWNTNPFVWAITFKVPLERPPNFQPVPIRGEPASVTLIRDRR